MNIPGQSKSVVLLLDEAQSAISEIIPLLKVVSGLVVIAAGIPNIKMASASMWILCKHTMSCLN